MRRPMAVLLAVLVSIGAALAVPTLSSASPHPRTASSGTPAKGIAVLLDSANAITDAQAMATGRTLFSIIASKLHANAVSFNFAYRQSSSTANDPSRGAITPSPQRLAALTAIAHRYGLSVQYRPYLFEGNLLNHSRTTIKPSNPTQWIQSYWAFLQPYLISANEAGVATFSVAQELPTLLPSLSAWTTLIQRAKTLFPRDLIYSQQHQPMVSIPLTSRGYDAYQPIPLKSASQVSVAAFTKGFERNFQIAGMQTTPADLTVEEIGLAAVAGAYNRPFFEHYATNTKIDRVVQQDWFQGACNAFWALHLRGLYYWAIGFNTFTPSQNNKKQLYKWYGTPTATVVASCFARTH